MKRCLLYINILIAFFFFTASENLHAQSGPPIISPQPSNQSTCVGGTVTFTTGNSVNGGSPSIIWYVDKTIDNTTGWEIASGSNYSRPTTYQLSIANVPFGFNNYKYYAEISNNKGPTSTNIVALTVKPLPISPIPTASSVARCGSGTVNLSVNGDQGTYRWYTTATDGTAVFTTTNSAISNFSPNVSQTTDYYVGVTTTVNDCESVRTKVTAIVNALPIAPTVTNAATCGPGSMTLTANNSTGSFKWYSVSSGGSAIATNVSDNGATFTTPTLSNTTTYYVTAVNAQGCESSPRTPVTATINVVPNAPTAPSMTRCGTGSVPLTASGSSGSYKWYDSDVSTAVLATGANYSTPSITAGNSITYYVSNVSAQGCEGARKAVTATANIVPDAVFSSDFTNVLIGEKVTFTYKGTATNGDTYSWSFDAGSSVSSQGVGPQMIAWNTPGVKTVTLTVSNSVTNCSSTSSASITVGNVYTWQGTVNKSWHIAQNWLPNGIPGANDKAIIETKQNQLEVNTNTVVKSLVLDSDHDVTLNATLSIGSNLTLIKGNIIATLTKDPFIDHSLIINAGATVTGANDKSYVDGPVLRYGNTPFTFPVGKGRKYRAISILPVNKALPSDAFRAEYFAVNSNASVGKHNNKENDIATLSTCEYWTLDRVAGTAEANISLSWINTTNCPINNPDDLIIAHWNGTIWENKGHSTATNPQTLADDQGEFASSEKFTSFSPVTLGSTTPNNPLPVDLLSFKAIPQKEGILLEWQTASETDNKGFEVQRSANGVSFNKMAFVEGAGNSQILNKYTTYDRAPLLGTTYYRLMQLDYSGKTKYSGIISAEQELTAAWVKVSPNPAPEQTTLQLNLPTAQTCRITLADATGRILYNRQVFAATFENIPLSMRHYAKGIYYLTVQGASRILYRGKLLKE